MRTTPIIDAELLDRARELALMHPFLAGELACGNFKGREETLSDLNALPSARIASDSEALQLIEGRRRNSA